MTFLLTHLLGIGGVLALLYATGYLIETASGPLPSAALGSFVTRTAAGSVGWIYALFALAALGGYRPAIVLPAIAAVLALALLVAVWRARRGGQRWPEPRWRGLGLGALAALPPATIVLALMVGASSLGVGHDDNVYHLLLPKLYLAHGGFVRVPFNMYSHWPHNVELLFGLAMMLDDYVLAKLLHTLYLVLTLIAVYRLCRPRCSRALASLATAFVLGNDVVIYEAAVANIDIAFAFYFLLAVACADAFLSQPERARPLVWSGVFCGALAGTKLSGLAGLACVAGLLVCRAPGSLRNPRYVLRLALCLVVPALLLALPWYVKSYLYTGNPLYPLFFRQLGGIEWSEQLNQQFFAWQHGMGMGRTLRDYALLPWRVIRDGGFDYGHFDGYLGQFWLAAIPVAVVMAYKTRRACSMVIAAGLYFVFWAASSQQLRFLIAALPPLAVAASLGLEKLCERSARTRVRALLRAMAWIATVVVGWPMLHRLEPAWHEAESLLERGPGERKDFAPRGYAFLNERTPASARVLMINENRGFFLDRPFIAESFPEASQVIWLIEQTQSAVGLRAKLDELGVTHIFVRPGALTLPANLQALLSDRKQTRRAHRCVRWRCEIYELR